MSNDIISMALATVAQKPALNVILKELQSEPGQELYVFPAERYLRWEVQLLCATAGSRARRTLSPLGIHRHLGIMGCAEESRSAQAGLRVVLVLFEFSLSL